MLETSASSNQNNIICCICNKEFPSLLSLALHIRMLHKINKKDYYDKYLKKEGEGICKNPTCPNKTKETKFLKLSLGYRDYCSQSCANLDPATKIKKEQTYAASHNGITHNMRDPDCLKEIKIKNNKLYGSDYFFGSEKGKEIVQNIIDNRTQTEIDKITQHRKDTCLEIYKVDNPSKLQEIKDKISDILSDPLRKHGESVKAGFKKMTAKEKEQMISNRMETVKNIERKTLQDKLPEGYEILEYNKIRNNEYHKLKCPKGHEFDSQGQMIRIRMANKEEICSVCNPYRTYEKSQNELLEFIKEHYKGEIISDNHKALDLKYEIDIWLPELKLGFEFNGIYWHGVEIKGEQYHKDKTEYAESKGIHLIHVWEDDWKFKQEIVKSRVLNILKMTKDKIYARDCIIKEIEYLTCEEFLNTNHLQGNSTSKIRLGLFYKDELVSVMTFGYLRRNLGNKNIKIDEYELIRFCNKINLNVIGGSSKLFKYFVDKYNPTEIISYADRSWSTTLYPNLYDKLGFKFVKVTEPNYYYIIKERRKNRFKYRKSNLIKEGFSNELTEKEIMEGRGIWRIYDSGSLKYRWNK